MLYKTIGCTHNLLVPEENVIGRNIRAIRAAAEMTQKDVEARDPRVEQSALSRWETGTLPDVPQLLRVAVALRVNVDQLVAGLYPDYDQMRKKEEDLLTSWRQIQSADIRRAVVNAAKHALQEERAARKRKAS